MKSIIEEVLAQKRENSEIHIDIVRELAEKALLIQKQEFEKILEEDFREQWIQYYKLAGGEIGVAEKMKINLERIKSKLNQKSDDEK